MRRASIKTSHYLLILITPPNLTFHVSDCCKTDMVTAEAGFFKTTDASQEKGKVQ
jgi:hypothetical protein